MNPGAIEKRFILILLFAAYFPLLVRAEGNVVARKTNDIGNTIIAVTLTVENGHCLFTFYNITPQNLTIEFTFTGDPTIRKIPVAANSKKGYVYLAPNAVSDNNECPVLQLR
jgi:hypothetical protein